MFTSQEAKIFEEKLEADLQKLRVQNDSLKLDAVETAHLRGRIRQIKDQLKFITGKDKSTDVKPVKYDIG